MGLAIAHRYAKAGYSVMLAARNVDTLKTDKADIEVRHKVGVTLHELDILDSHSFAGFVASLPQLPDTAVNVVGYMGDQPTSEKDTAAATIVMRSNYEGPSLLLGVLAQAFEKRGSGTLIGVSSVAGLRGRASNYVYGSAKAGYTAFLSGLRNRLARKGVHVLTVLPGFVATRMTEGMDLPKPLTTTPQVVAEAVFNAARKGRNVIYVKSVWWLVMMVIRHLPEFVFKKTNL